MLVASENKKAGNCPERYDKRVESVDVPYYRYLSIGSSFS